MDGMRLEIAYPPNIEKIDKRFKVKNTSNILYCYGDTIYSPQGGKIPLWLIAHEEIHSKRQLEKGVEEWWNAYIEYPEFCLQEEMLAHRREFEVYKAEHNRHSSRAHLVHMAKRLSSGMYGNCIDFKSAKREIKETEE